MNVGEISTRVMRQFGDESGAQLLPEDISRWINDGSKEIARTNHLLETKKIADVLAAQSEYDLPDDLLELWSVRWNNYKLKSLSMEQADEYITNSEDSQNYQQGNPSVFWQWQNKITLYPIPQGALVKGLTIFYSKIPAEVAIPGDIPELPTKYHARIVEYCLKQAYELDEDYNASQMKGTQLKGELGEMLETEKWTSRDYYPTITVRSEDY